MTLYVDCNNQTLKIEKSSEIVFDRGFLGVVIEIDLGYPILP